MKPTHRIAAALTLTALVAGAPLSASAGGRHGQDNPFEKLKSYDFQTYAPIEAIRKMIAEAQNDKAKTADIEQHLIGVLEDANATFAGKQEACRLLWIIGTGRSVPILSKLLNDPKQSDIARYALERNPDRSAAKALRAALTTTKGTPLIGVINSEGDRGDVEAVGTLKGFTTSADPLVSEAAIAALGKIGTPSALAALRSLPASNLLAEKATLRIAEHFAATGKTADALKIYDGLTGEGKPPVIRGEALRGLAVLQSAHTAPVALTFLKSTDPYLEEVGARTTGTMPDPQTTRTVLGLYSSLPPAPQAVLLTAWGERKETAAASVIESSLQSPDPQVRGAAILALSRIGGGKAVPALVKIARSGEGEDRRIARESLQTMPGADAEQAILQTALKGAPADRALMMGLLSERPSPAVTAALLDAANGSDSAVAVEAARALGKIGGMKEHAALLKVVVTTHDVDIRDAARDAIVNIGTRLGNRDAAAAPVLAALPGTAGASKAALLAILAGTGSDRALDELTRAANSQDAEVKQAAVTLLAESWGDTRPLPTLQYVAKTSADKSLRVESVRGYLNLVGQDEKMPSDQKVAKIALILPLAERPEEKRKALSVLRECRLPASVELVSTLLDNPTVGSDAADTILDLAAEQRRNNKSLPAVRGEATTAALNKISQTGQDSQKQLAQKLKNAS
ncbi:MAG: repeat protein [Chthonomonadaceae bacterium]|nr:repeat protein [Chthonomonadaceae bacterium]